MRAYVSIRGSRSPRRVDRDAPPPRGGADYPYAALTFPDGSGGCIKFELSYTPDLDGGAVIHLTRYEPAIGTRTIYRHKEPKICNQPRSAASFLSCDSKKHRALPPTTPRRNGT